MDAAMQTMITNLHQNTGKTLEEWVAIVRKQNLPKHGAIVKYLKEEHGFTHGFANLVAHKSLGSDADSAQDTNELLEKQYKGKEHFKPLYDSLLSQIQGFGKDIEVSPKNAYVSLRRKKQFATLQPATKTRFEIGLNLKGEPASGVAEAITTPNAMCSHKINLATEGDLTPEVVQWVKKAYEKAG
jgi:predicted transport protein